MMHFIDPFDLPAGTLPRLLDQALARKQRRGSLPHGAPDADAPAAGRVLASVFMRPSTRTRISFEIAMKQLGGSTLTLDADAMQLKRGESIADTARALSQYVDIISVRTGAHAELHAWADAASVPIVNALTAHLHPCQMLADVMTLHEHRNGAAGKMVAWIGDGDNNVCRSWMQAAALFNFSLRIAAPPSLRGEHFVVDADVRYFDDPHEAAAGVDAVVTDTRVSMDCADPDARNRLLEPYQVNAALMARAHADAIFLHCLPAHRGEEVTDDVLDGKQSAVWHEAANRVHAQKAVLLACLEA